METTTHAFAKILYILGGSGNLTTGGRTYPLRAGRIVIIPPRTPHHLADLPGRPLSLYFLCVRGPVLPLPEASKVLGEICMIGHSVLGRTLRHLFQDLLYEQTASDAGAELAITGRVLELLGLIQRWKSRGRGKYEDPEAEKPLSRARVRMAIAETERYFYRPQSLEQTAERTGLKPRRFSQLFREISGLSWPAFLREKRIRHARRLLAETHRSVAAICFECGFEDLSSFYRAFHRFETTSPLAWRTSQGKASVGASKTASFASVPKTTRRQSTMAPAAATKAKASP
jgi:AraC-like DNA-binding protein